MNAPRSVNDRRCIRSIGGVQEGGKGEWFHVRILFSGLWIFRRSYLEL